MKKTLTALSVFFVCLLVLTGCGSTKKLTCTKADDDAKVDVVAKFDENGVISSFVETDTFTFDSASEAEEAKTLTDAFSSTYNALDGYTYSSKVSGTKLIVSITIDVSKLSEDEKEDYSLTYDQAKENLVQSGYTCK